VENSTRVDDPDAITVRFDPMPVRLDSPTHAGVAGKRQDLFGELRIGYKKRAYFHMIRISGYRQRSAEADKVRPLPEEALTGLHQVQPSFHHCLNQLGNVASYKYHVVICHDKPGAFSDQSGFVE
jgi:hypothetical protein